jgi:predicted NAD/FAD-binding protein
MRIAVIGAGISGLVCAYLLSDEHEVTVYEANDYIGGHTHTIDVPLAGRTYSVDTGFIVFNLKTYPNFLKLMQILGVAWQPSNMSFSLHCLRTGIFYSPSTLNSLFAQRSNILRPGFYRMLLDALRFRREALSLLQTNDDRTTLSAYLRQNRYSDLFIEKFIIPMGAAIWSADPDQFRDFPARYLVEFFHNHGFLNLRDQPQWLVVKGGSRQYIEPLTRPFRDQIRLNAPVAAVQRSADQVTVTTAGGDRDRFDRVIIAAHSDQALAMLADPSDREREILGPIPYQENHTILHTDSNVLPPKRAAWASWNYRIPKAERGRVALTYDMNLLQGLNAPEEFCVSLNMTEDIDPRKIIRSLVYHHPVYDPRSLAARRGQEALNGVNRTYYCGAYWGYGFHEDGVNSALAVCNHFGKALAP